MRERRVIVLAKACAVVGTALAAYGTITDHAAMFRIGFLVLIVSASVHLHVTSRLNMQAVMAHQVSMARLTIQDRQRYSEMGYKAAQYDALVDDTPEIEGGAEVVELPHARLTPQARRNGSA
jgi:hypothetical protein